MADFSPLARLVVRYASDYPRDMQCDECENPATVQIAQFRDRTFRSEDHLCEGCVQAHRIWSRIPDTRYPASVSSMRDEVEVDIETIIISEIHEQQVVVLRELHGSRTFSIVIGIFEATSLDRRLKGQGTTRPLTFDAWLATIKTLGARVEAVCVRSLDASIFFTDLRLAGRDGRVAVDTRPSDAFNIAVTSGAPILINERLLAAVQKSPS